MSQETAEISFLKHRHGNVIWDWLTTVDHKKIGILYFGGGLLFFLVAGIEAILIRTQLMFPDNDFVSAATYNQLMTMHGTTMIFFAAMPMVFGLINFVVPLQIGARDVAFPFVNALGFWLYFAGAIFTNIGWFTGGAADAGWTGYAPFSSSEYSSSGVDYYTIGLQISGFGTLMGAINFLVTIINMRAPGMTFLRMPLFTWTSFVMSGLILFAFPPLTVDLFLLMFDRIFGANFFDPTMGGNVLIWEHLFWIFGHPEVYILVLPAFGVFSEVFSTFSSKRLFGYRSMVFATALIGFLSFMVWAHHMFTSGLGPVADSIFGVMSMTIAVPTGIKIFNWLFTMWGGKVKFTTASLYAISFIPSFLLGGLTGVMVAVPAADYQFHDSYFIVAHFHYVIVGGVAFGLFAAVFYWWPKVFGRKLDEKLGKWHFWLFLFGFHITFFPQHYLGLFGMPRRYFTYHAGEGFFSLNFVSSLGTLLMTAALLLLVVNIVITSFKGEKAGIDPWGTGRTLEWSLPSPPPVYNFAQTPLVTSQDPWWHAKVSGDGKVPPAEPVGEIHLPSPSILPLVMSAGLFILGLGLIYYQIVLVVAGFLLTFGSMLIHSLFDDHGYHITPQGKEMS